MRVGNKPGCREFKKYRKKPVPLRSRIKSGNRCGLLVYFLFFVWVFSPVQVNAQWNSFVVNYKKEQFGRGSQTWAVESYDANRLYYGNKNGMLEFKGNEWALHPLDNKTDVRSIRPSIREKKIYVGGDSEFGYFEPGANGALQYTNLATSFNEKYDYAGSYWGVYEVDNLIYYVSDNFIIKQLDKDFSVIESGSKIDCSGVVNGVLYVGTTEGIKMLIGNTLFPLPAAEALAGKTIREIIPYKSGMLVATAFDGLYYFHNQAITPFLTGAEEFMKQNEIFTIAASERYIAIGTIHKGLLLLEPETGHKEYYNENNGLQNNTVLSLHFDKQDNLWLGLDNGIDYIPLNQAYTNLYTYPHSKGAGYAVLLYNDRLYLGTNRGIYYLSYPVSLTEEPCDIRFISGLSGQVWDLIQVEELIFCLHDKGLFIIDKNNRIEFIPELRGAISGYPHLTDPDKYWIGTYDSLFLLSRTDNKWKVSRRIEGVNEWMKNIAFENPGTIWIRVVNQGVRRVDLDTTTYQVTNTYLYTEDDGFDSVENICIHSDEDKICFTTNSGIYIYDPESNRIVLSEILNQWFIPGNIYRKICRREDKIYILSPNMMRIANYSYTEGMSEAKVYPFSHRQIDFIPQFENMYFLSDTFIIIPNEKGFALLNTQESVKRENPGLFLESIYLTYPDESLLYKDNFSGRSHTPEIPYSNNALRFEYALHSFNMPGEVPYRFRLLPDPTWSNPTFSKVKEYNNLREGKYTFEAEALLPGEQTVSTRYSFQILPPWYRSVYAWLAYIFLFICFLSLLYKLEERRIVRRRQAELDKKDKEIKQKEQEFAEETFRREQIIIELKNENLEQQLKFKSQEMANLMINLSRKNEILQSIKEELSKIMGEMKSDAKQKRMLLTLNSRIDLNMESDDLLKKFEEQFNLVHNNFIKKINRRHPDLNVTERKMCAYVKMNLSSKEIAPLLNMSVRGVETLRYRLRKKLGLEREAGLSEYLHSIENQEY